jgi:hypothetical protein
MQGAGMRQAGRSDCMAEACACHVVVYSHALILMALHSAQTTL